MTPAQERVEEALRVADICVRTRHVPGALTETEASAFEVLASELRRLRTQAEGMREALMGCRDYNAISDALKWAGLGGLMRSKIMLHLSDVRYRPAALRGE